MFITKKKIEEMINEAVNDAIDYLVKRCQTCGSGLIKYKEFSPDGPPYYFCSKRCFKKWKKESNEIYRASPLEKIPGLKKPDFTGKCSPSCTGHGGKNVKKNKS